MSSPRKDSAASGLLHVRNDHANVQFRINGVMLPDGVTGFGSILETSLIGNLSLVTGALTDDFGLRTVGLDITTRTDVFNNSGSISPYGSSREQPRNLRADLIWRNMAARSEAIADPPRPLPGCRPLTASRASNTTSSAAICRPWKGSKTGRRDPYTRFLPRKKASATCRRSSTQDPPEPYHGNRDQQIPDSRRTRPARGGKGTGAKAISPWRALPRPRRAKPIVLTVLPSKASRTAPRPCCRAIGAQVGRGSCGASRRSARRRFCRSVWDRLWGSWIVLSAYRRPDQSRGGGARHRRSSAGDGHGAYRGDSGGRVPLAQLLGGGLELEQTLPEAARARAKQGTVRLALTIDRSGMSCRHGSGSSGSAALDPAALDIARHASGRHCRRKWDQASVSGANQIPHKVATPNQERSLKINDGRTGMKGQIMALTASKKLLLYSFWQPFSVFCRRRLKTVLRRFFRPPTERNWRQHL